jgi:transposase-like protein
MQTIFEFDRLFPNEDACRQFLQDQRWPHGVQCPRCGNVSVYALKARPFHWVCKSGKQSIDPEGREVVCAKNGGYRFSVISHTIFQDTKIELRLWFKVAYLILTAKKGMSALQVHRIIFGEDSGSDYRTSWYMVMRLRTAMKSEVLPLEGEVEVDETFVGGKAHNMHAKDRKRAALTGTKGKVAVIGAIARKGMIIARVIENTDTDTLDSFVHETVSQKVRLIATNEHSGYRLLGRDMNHHVVRHSAGEFVVRTTHTNTIEGFWSLFKRRIVGSYHKVSKEYLPLYVNEFAWRFNNRKNPAMFADLIQSVSR